MSTRFDKSINADFISINLLNSSSAEISNLVSDNAQIGVITSTTANAATVNAVTVNAGTVTGAALSVTNGSSFGGLIQGGLLLTSGQQKLNYYSTTSLTVNNIYNSSGSIVNNSNASFIWARIGNVVSLYVSWNSASTVSISGSYIVFKNVVPAGYSPSGQIVAAVLLFFGTTADLAALQISGNDIWLGPKGSAVGNFQSNVTINLYGASISYPV